MKALTIWQPWASLIISGHKRVENRRWLTHYRGPLAIHAARQVDPEADDILSAAGVTPPADAPRGVILGVVDVVDVVRFGSRLPGFDEYNLGPDLFAWGPYCWILRNPRPLATPIPARGQPGLWDFRETMKDE